jgi:hypothetical protein
MTNYVLICKNDKDSVYIHKTNKEKFIKLTFSQIHKKNLISIKKDDHEEFSKFDKIFKDHDVLLDTIDTEIILIPELNKNELLLYINECVHQNTLKEFKKILKMNLYYQNSLNVFDVKKRLCDIMENLDNFWEKYNVVNINLTESFKSKKFNLNTCKNNISDKNDLLIKDIDYLNEIKNFSEENIKQKNIYYINEHVDINYDEIANMYEVLTTEYMKYCFLANLLCSKKHCHLVLKNKKLLIQSKDIVDKYKIAFKYFFSYGWLTFMSYELLTKKICDDDLYVLDLETANLLPKFPFTYDDINQNPYTCMLVNEDEANVSTNLLSMDFDENYEYYNGLPTVNEFSRRLNIFCNKKNEEGYLKFIDWESCAITGSAVSACSQNGYRLINNDREENHKINEYTDEELNNYFNNNKYKNSDIDLICNKESYFDFNNTVYELFTNISNENKSTNLTYVTSSVYVMNEEMLENEIENLKKIILEQKYDIRTKEINTKTIKLYFGKEAIKKYFYDKYYVGFKREQNDKYLTVINNKYGQKKNSFQKCIDALKINKEKQNIFYLKYSTPCDLEKFSIKILSYDATLDNTRVKENEKLFFDKNDSNKIVAKVTESIRYQIETDNTKTIEVFRCKSKNFMSSICNFHFAFVRGYWNGKTLQCMPSLIGSTMNDLSWENKYFASITHPAKIINKYRFGRGKNIIINNNCRREIVIHMLKNIEDYPEYNIGLVNEELSEKVKKVFRFCHEENKNAKKFDETFSKIIVENLGFMNKLKSINGNGSVNPLNKNYINIFYEEINKDNRRKRELTK